jgi:CRP/FNR family transcriptional regulator
MTTRSGALQTSGPEIRAVPLIGGLEGTRVSLLSPAGRRELAAISEPVHVKPGMPLYRQGEEGAAVYNLIRGVVKTTRRQRHGRQAVTAFLFPFDLVGLIQNGRYVNSAVAVTPVTAYRMPTLALEILLRRNAELGYQFLSKLCQEVREEQRHTITVGRLSAACKIARFLNMLESRQPASPRCGEIEVAMRRADIADYVALSPESVSRTFRALQQAKIIDARDRRRVRILDRGRFEPLLVE